MVPRCSTSVVSNIVSVISSIALVSKSSRSRRAVDDSSPTNSSRSMRPEPSASMTLKTAASAPSLLRPVPHSTSSASSTSKTPSRVVAFTTSPRGRMPFSAAATRALVSGSKSGPSSVRSRPTVTPPLPWRRAAKCSRHSASAARCTVAHCTDEARSTSSFRSSTCSPRACASSLSSATSTVVVSPPAPSASALPSAASASAAESGAASYANGGARGGIRAGTAAFEIGVPKELARRRSKNVSQRFMRFDSRRRDSTSWWSSSTPPPSSPPPRNSRLMSRAKSPPPPSTSPRACACACACA
mmetsp:Transcript_2510/g.8579  ORF Transcript_2510/g.8579 Transcript_2510/m.8579 type:complete len:301 (-) Transcript_2510:176-1078(-)